MNKDFKLFQQEFIKWQKYFGLTGYNVYFKFEPVDGCFARIDVNSADMVVTVTLNSKLDKKAEPFKDIARSAKHEAIHLLLARLEDRACSRYAEAREISDTIEELTFKLENLISV